MLYTHLYKIIVFFWIFFQVEKPDIVHKGERCSSRNTSSVQKHWTYWWNSPKTQSIQSLLCFILWPLLKKSGKSGRDGEKCFSYSYSAGEKLTELLEVYSFIFFAGQCYGYIWLHFVKWNLCISKVASYFNCLFLWMTPS